MAHDEIVVHCFSDDRCHRRRVELNEGVVLGFSGLIEAKKFELLNGAGERKTDLFIPWNAESSDIAKLWKVSFELIFVETMRKSSNE